MNFLKGQTIKASVCVRACVHDYVPKGRREEENWESVDKCNSCLGQLCLNRHKKHLIN